nr:SDR family NAD(P)-dependent oxidoreductase [Companilactobacillus futsaii]
MSKVIVITGASDGIGEGSAKLLAKQGNLVVLGARREKRLEEITQVIKKDGGQAIAFAVNVPADTAINELVMRPTSQQ